MRNLIANYRTSRQSQKTVVNDDGKVVVVREHSLKLLQSLISGPLVAYADEIITHTFNLISLPFKMIQHIMLYAHCE